jgi:hypothetical protein
MRTSTQHLAASLLTQTVLTGRGATPQFGSDADVYANFAGYHSFALLPRVRVVATLPADALRNPRAISCVENEVNQQMQRKGYTLTDLKSADLVVDFDIGARERNEGDSSPGGFGFCPERGPWRSDMDVPQVREGTLVIDMFDAHTRQPVWHGWTQKALTAKDVQQWSTPIHDAVELVLAKFPKVQ